MDFTIYRGSWRRGGSAHDNTLGLTQLFHPITKQMCCLGQMAYQLGVPLEKLQCGYLYAVVLKHPEFLSVLQRVGLIGSFGQDTPTVTGAVIVNDDQWTTDEVREQSLINGFAVAGHTVRFVDGIAPWFEVPVVCTASQELNEVLAAIAAYIVADGWDPLVDDPPEAPEEDQPAKEEEEEPDPDLVEACV